MLRILIYFVLAIIVWKVVKMFFSGWNLKSKEPDKKVGVPQDKSFKNIEDADFEDITPDSDKPS